MKIRPSILVFIVAIILAFLQHDIYQVGLAVAFVILCYWLFSAINTKSNKALVGKFSLFACSSIAFAQIGVLFRKGVLDTGVREMVEHNPTGYIIGDILYGFRHTAIAFWESSMAVWNGIAYENFQGIDSVNPRFATLSWSIFVLGIVLIFKSRKKRNS